jgi:hypothetical protein
MFLTMVITLRRRRAIPLDLFYGYWVNAHAAQIAARLPGIHNLRLHELSYEDGQLWPRLPGIEFDLPEQDRFEGIPEPVFADQAGVESFLGSMAPLMDDEANIFEETIAYQSLGANSHTFADRTGADGGDRSLLRFFLFLKASEDVSGEAFRAWAKQELAPRLASSEHVVMLRQHLFEPYHDDYGGLDARGLSHAKEPEKQYQAMVEIAFHDALGLGLFARSEVWADLAEQLPQSVRACHPFRVGITHTLRRDGQLTLDGQRTPMVADLIRRVGAASQLEPAVVDVVLGKPAQAEVLV